MAGRPVGRLQIEGLCPENGLANLIELEVIKNAVEPQRTRGHRRHAELARQLERHSRVGNPRLSLRHVHLDHVPTLGLSAKAASAEIVDQDEPVHLAGARDIER